MATDRTRTKRGAADRRAAVRPCARPNSNQPICDESVRRDNPRTADPRSVRDFDGVGVIVVRRTKGVYRAASMYAQRQRWKGKYHEDFLANGSKCLLIGACR